MVIEVGWQWSGDARGQLLIDCKTEMISLAGICEYQANSRSWKYRAGTEQVETLANFRHMPQFPDLSEVWFCSILFLPRTWNFLENNKEFFSAQLYSHILSIFLYQLMTLLSHFETLHCIFVRDGYTLAFSGASTVVVIPSNFIHSFFFLSNLTNFQLSPFCPKQRIFPDID